jgi:hypothetical protein
VRLEWFALDKVLASNLSTHIIVMKAMLQQN